MIHETSNYNYAMGQIDELMSLNNLSDNQVLRLKRLALLAEKYETEHFPVKSPSTIDAAEFRIDQLKSP